MKKRFVLALTALLAAGAFLQAQEVIMKNGTIYTGYVSEQSPSSNKATVTYTAAQYTVPGDSIQISRSKDNITARWGKSFADSVEILEDGDLVTFLAYGKKSVTVKLSDIERITYLANSKVHDVMVADRSYEGNIKEVIVGKYVKMDVDEKTIVVADKNIRSQTKVSVDREKSLNVNMFPYLDVYEVKNMPTLTGVLISQNYIDGSAIFLTREGAMMPISMGNITNIRRIPNDAFDDSVPVEKDTVDVRINNKVAKWIEAKIDKKEVVSFSVEKLPESILSVTENTVSVNVNENRSSLALIPFDPFSSKSGTLTLGKLEDLAKKALESNNSYPMFERKVTVYESVKPGFYLLLDSTNKRVAPVLVN